MSVFNKIKKSFQKIKEFSEYSLINKNKIKNPYLNAKTTWNDRTEFLISSRRYYQFVGMLSLLIALSSVGGIIYIGSQSKFIPLIFREDAQHNIISVTRGNMLGSASIDDYRYQAENFIENIRLVTPDIALQRRAIFRAYAVLAPNDAATFKTNDFLQNNSPFERAAQNTVNTEIQSILQATEDSWQIDWLETVRDRKGKIIEQYMMRAIMTLYQNEPTQTTSEEELLNNPHFIFVQDFNWSKQQRKVH